MAFSVSKRDLSWKRAENSPFMQRLAKDNSLNRRQAGEVYAAIRDTSGGGRLDRKGISQAFGKLEGKHKYLSKGKIFEIAKKTLPGYKASERISHAGNNPGNNTASRSSVFLNQFRASGAPTNNLSAPAPRINPASTISSINFKGMSGITSKMKLMGAKSDYVGVKRDVV